MKSLKSIFVLLSIFIMFFSQNILADIYYSETITDSTIYRIVNDIDDDNKSLFEQTLSGNDKFMVTVNSLTFNHSVNGIEPPLLPDGTVRMARLKLSLRNNSGEDISLTVDGIDFKKANRRNFIIGTNKKSISVDQSALKDGILEIKLENPDEPFEVYESVFDMEYVPAVPTSVAEIVNGLPEGYALEANYPNPFNPSTTIKFTVPVKADVQIIVYNMVGQKIKTLINQTMPAGTHSTSWDGTDKSGNEVTTGIYFYKIITDGYSLTKKMMLLK